MTYRAAVLDRRLIVIVSVIALDAVGIGLMFPILPTLLRSLLGTGEISFLYGVTLAIYSFMQLVFSPVLGAASDRFGRRPVLLASIAGATVDYVLMAVSPKFGVLLVGRAIAGLLSANMAVATAYVADITTEDDRAKRFGQMNAGFGIGFIVGPVLGGVLGDVWLRAPFAAAAALNLVNLALVFFVLKESRPVGEPAPFRLQAMNPLGPVRWALGVKSLAPLIGMFGLLGLVGNIPGTVWVLYGQDKFHWDPLMIGLSLATFGVCHAGAQGVLTAPITRRLGEARATIVALVCDGTAFVCVGLAHHGWVAFAVAPLFALGGVAMPALQTLAAREAGESKQGELQGVIASVLSGTAIVGPLIGTAVYAATKDAFLGAVWVGGASMYVLAAPLLWSRLRGEKPISAETKPA